MNPAAPTDHHDVEEDKEDHGQHSHRQGLTEPMGLDQLDVGTAAENWRIG